MELSEFIKKVKKARKYGEEKHKGQWRRSKKDGKRVEFFEHPKEVAQIVWSLKNSHRITDLIIAAYLHDTVEDTDASLEEIKKEFGDLVASLVDELTSDTKSLKEIGKKEYLKNKMLNMTSWGLIIKLADRLHNVQDVPEKLASDNNSDRKWAKKYAKQTGEIIRTLENERVLSSTQMELIELIKERIKEYY